MNNSNCKELFDKSLIYNAFYLIINKLCAKGSRITPYEIKTILFCQSIENLNKTIKPLTEFNKRPELFNTYTSLSLSLARLVKAGYITRIEKGYYKITPDGYNFIKLIERYYAIAYATQRTI